MTLFCQMEDPGENVVVASPASTTVLGAVVLVSWRGNLIVRQIEVGFTNKVQLPGPCPVPGTDAYVNAPIARPGIMGIGAP